MQAPLSTFKIDVIYVNNDGTNYTVADSSDVAEGTYVTIYKAAEGSTACNVVEIGTGKTNSIVASKSDIGLSQTKVSIQIITNQAYKTLTWSATDSGSTTDSYSFGDKNAAVTTVTWDPAADGNTLTITATLTSVVPPKRLLISATSPS